MIGRHADDGPEGTRDEQDGRPPEAAEGRGDRHVHASRSRRGVLRGMAGMGVGVGTTTPGRVLEAVEDTFSEVDEAELPGSDSDPDPHTVATFRAVVDAVIPPTPELTDKLSGERLTDDDRVQRYGGLTTDLAVQGVRFINDFISPETAVPRLSNTGETANLSEAVAAILDSAAAELLGRNGNEDRPEPGRFGPAGGPFASLARTDRFRALKDIEDNGGKNGGFVVALTVAFPALVHYSDLDGYDDFLDAPPSERAFEPAEHNTFDPGDGVDLGGGQDALLGWRQSGYPGIDAGYDALLGYELDESYAATGYGRHNGNGRPGRGPGRAPGSGAGGGGDGPADDEPGAEGSGGDASDAGGDLPPGFGEWLDGGGRP